MHPTSFVLFSDRGPHVAGMRSLGLERVERLLGHLRQGHLDEDEELRFAGQGQDVGLRSSDDPEGDVRGPHSTLRRSV